MSRRIQSLLNMLLEQSLARGTAIISAIIAVVVLLADWLINQVLMPGLTPYTPYATLLIVILTAPPFTFVLLLQTVNARKAQSRLVQEQAARSAIETAHEVKSQFLSRMSHELRTPLNAIMGYAELIAEEHGGRNPVLARDIERIQAASAHLLEMVNDILDLSKVEAGKLRLQVSHFKIADVVEEVAALVRPQAEKNQNTVFVHIEDAAITCFGDELRLRQCLLNLASNAVKFTNQGEVRINARSESRDGVPGICLEVRDTGIGMSPATISRLFRPFEQADNSDTRRYEGAGLGLAITKQLMELMSGEVSVMSAANDGSTFRLWLPARQPREHMLHLVA